MAGKHERQFAIKEILGKGAIRSQENLQKMLKKNGVDISQATLSRDLAEMGVGRFNNSGERSYIVNETEDPRLKNLLSYETTSIEHNECLIVIKTLSGRAHGVAELIDSLKNPDILATIAGDNTIFISPRSTKIIKELYLTLRDLITK